MQAKDTATALFKQLDNTIKEPLLQGKIVSIGISHADNLKQAKELEEIIINTYPQIKIQFVTAMGSVIGAHVGPGALICCSIN
jgi:fatty acid-binding protein DegV